MQSDGAGPVRGASGKDSGQSIARIFSGMHFERRTDRLMEIGENPGILAGLDAVKSVDKLGIDFQSRIGRALPSLTTSKGTLLEGWNKRSQWE